MEAALNDHSDNVPGPVTELFPESLDLSPKQRLVLDSITAHPEGIKARELADELEMHINTVRGHLDELIDRGAVTARTLPSQGRGRPSLIFSARIPDNRSIAAEYVNLISVMAERVTDPEEARQIGAGWATLLNQQKTEQELADILNLLRDMGFNPVASTDGYLLTSCPFITKTGKRPTPSLCQMHAAFMDNCGCRHEEPAELLPFAAPGACMIRLG